MYSTYRQRPCRGLSNSFSRKSLRSTKFKWSTVAESVTKFPKLENWFKRVETRLSEPFTKRFQSVSGFPWSRASSVATTSEKLCIVHTYIHTRTVVIVCIVRPDAGKSRSGWMVMERPYAFFGRASYPSEWRCTNGKRWDNQVGLFSRI